VLHRLPAERAAAALAIGATHAGGLAPNFGTMTKPYHAGGRRAMVDCGASGSSRNDCRGDALEHPQGFQAFSAVIPIAVSRWAGAEWYLLRQTCASKYPTCCMPLVDAAVRMLAGRATADDIAEIEVTMGKGQTTVLARRPQTGLKRTANSSRWPPR
jgi:hypothetical protein